jgi:2-dehydro-3-deoxyphosphogluconate aldolase/(4S)-4-hydroxy-2-oxoglutarate aldolase
VSPLEFIKKHKVISVIRAENESLALSFAEACIEGGLRLIEVTFSFPGAERVINSLSGREDVLVGAGTVLDIEMAEKARDAGARFLVSPHTDEALINFAKANGMAVIQGAFTSSEIVRAWKLGVDMVKIFPVSAVGGPSYVKAMKEPLPQIEIMTTGGVGLDNLADFLRAGASAVGLSTALTGRGGGIDPETITANARLFARKLEKIGRA